MKIFTNIKRTISVVMCILVAVVFTSCNTNTETISYDGLAVSYIDVGQGDSILLQCDGESMLIDAGENDYGITVIDYLKKHGADKLKYAVGTHPHSDHIGGMDTVINEIPTENFICPQVNYETKTWKDVLSAVENQGANTIYAKSGDSYTLGETTFTILSPDKDNIYKDGNNYSVVIKAEYKNTSFLFTGDAEALVEKQIIENGYNVKADVLKVGHHGSTSSTSEEFLNAVNPDYGVICCGKDNEYGHPHRETLEKLQCENVTVYRTDIDGNIVANSNGDQIRFLIGHEEYTNEEDAQGAVKGNTSQTDNLYIGNKNSKKYHRKDCSAVSVMKEENKIYFGNSQDALAKGYSPCKNCNP